MHNYVEQTSRYMEKHKLRENLETCVNEVLRNRPDDPYVVLAREIRKFAVPDVIYVQGPPGSHKESLCDLVSKDYGFAHISVKRLLEKERAAQNENSDFISNCMREHRPVPTELFCKLLEDELEMKRKQGQIKIVLSGMPYSQEIDETWTRMCNGRFQTRFVVNVSTPRQVCGRRLLEEEKDIVEREMHMYSHYVIPAMSKYEADGSTVTVNGVGQTYSELKTILGVEFDSRAMETVVAILKPDVMSQGDGDKIVDMLRREGFEILAQEGRILEEEEAERLFEEKRGTSGFRSTVSFFCSGHSNVLVLRRINALRMLQGMAGEENPMDAQANSPTSIRAIYGTDTLQNAIHVSETLVKAALALDILFPLTSFDVEYTLAVMKPDIVERGLLDEVTKEIKDAGFTIVAQKMLTLQRDKAEALLEPGQKHSKGRPESKPVHYLISGTIVVFVLEKVNAVREWQALLGPADLESARKLPNCLRGKYMRPEHPTKDCFHASASLREANREIKQMFSESPSLNQLGPRLILHGLPGAGKMTQAEILCTHFGTVHLRLSSMIKEVVEARSELGNTVDGFIRRQLPVPDDKLVEVIKIHLAKHEVQRRGWVLTGFPNTLAQATALARMNAVPDHFISLDIPEIVGKRRLERRRMDPETQKIYNTETHMPTDTEVVDRLVSFPDDTKEGINARVLSSMESMNDLKDRFWNVLVKVDGDRPVKKVYQNIISNLWAIE